MRHLICLLICAAALLAGGCVLPSGDGGKDATPGDSSATTTGTAPAGGATDSVDSGGVGLLDELPEGVTEDDILKIEVPQMSPPDGATPGAGAEAITGPVAKNFNAEVIVIRPLDDPENPFAGQYTDFDRWHYDNFDPTAPFMASGKPGERSGSLNVTDLGFIEPSLVTLRHVLEYIKGDTSVVPGFEKEFQLYSRGVLSPELDAQATLDSARLTAEYAPPIPDWLASRPPRWALILPDGNVATYGQLGTGGGFYPVAPDWLRQEPVPPCHYSADGRLVKRLEAGQLWCELFFPGFEKALEKHQIKRGDVLTFDRYVVFRNSNDEALTGHYLYDGTPLSAEEMAAITDATRHFELYGKYLPVMYEVQQGLKQK